MQAINRSKAEEEAAMVKEVIATHNCAANPPRLTVPTRQLLDIAEERMRCEKSAWQC